MADDAQMAALIAVLKEIAETKPYTITGAADWGMLVAIGGLLTAAIVAMWLDLKNTMTGYSAGVANLRKEFKEEMEKLRAEFKEEFDIMWSAMKDCQKDCCPRGKKE